MSAKNDYRAQLWLVFEARVKRNSAYSLSAFARDLKISLSSLSLILHNKRGISSKRAQDMCARLGFTQAQSSAFMTSVEQLHARTKQARSVRKIEVEDTENSRRIAPQKLSFTLTWRHLVLREYTQLPDFTNDPQWLAQKLGTSAYEAKKIWKQALEAELIVPQGERFLSSEHLAIGDKGPDQTIRHVHRDLLGKAIESIERPLPDRSITALMVTISENQYLEMRRLIRTFNAELCNTLKKTDKDKKDRVVCLATQIFEI